MHIVSHADFIYFRHIYFDVTSMAVILQYSISYSIEYPRNKLLDSRSTIAESPIGGFKDTYLGRQVVSRPGGPRAGMGSAGV